MCKRMCEFILPAGGVSGAVTGCDDEGVGGKGSEAPPAATAATSSASSDSFTVAYSGIQCNRRCVYVRR